MNDTKIPKQHHDDRAAKLVESHFFESVEYWKQTDASPDERLKGIIEDSENIMKDSGRWIFTEDMLQAIKILRPDIKHDAAMELLNKLYTTWKTTNIRRAGSDM